MLRRRTFTKESTMQNGSSLEASSNVGTSSETVTLAVDGETVGKLGEAAVRAGEWGCAVIEHSDD
jgi:hypothetical protein